MPAKSLVLLTLIALAAQTATAQQIAPDTAEPGSVE